MLIREDGYVAQLAEHRAFNLMAVGSSPAVPKKTCESCSFFYKKRDHVTFQEGFATTIYSYPRVRDNSSQKPTKGIKKALSYAPKGIKAAHTALFPSQPLSLLCSFPKFVMMPLLILCA